MRSSKNENRHGSRVRIETAVVECVNHHEEHEEHEAKTEFMEFFFVFFVRFVVNRSSVKHY
jgi:hypothetical protein